MVSGGMGPTLPEVSAGHHASTTPLPTLRVTLQRCQIKKSYCFVEFLELEDATDACKELNGSRILGREVTVEFCVQDAQWSARARSPPREERRRYDDDRSRRHDDDRSRRHEDDRVRRYRSRSRSAERQRTRRSPSYSPPAASPPPRRRVSSRSPERPARQV